MLGQLHTLGIGAQGRLVGAPDATHALALQAEALARGEPFDRVLLDFTWRTLTREPLTLVRGIFL